MPSRVALALLLAATAVASGCSRAPAPKPTDRGARLYVTNCMACHQANGEGVAGLQPPLAGTPVPNGDPAVMAAWVMFGARPSPSALPRGKYSNVMPQFAFLSDADLAALLTYVRSSFGNHADPITPEFIAGVRAAPH
jgi:mono/diheme cytochrome c family protein